MSKFYKTLWKKWSKDKSPMQSQKSSLSIGLVIIKAIIFLIWFVFKSDGQWSFDSLNLLGTCYKWNTIVPACQQWDYNGWLSCSEGLYLVVDSQVWVESCDLAIISSTDTNQSKYFARRDSRMCYRCGIECANCVNELGWTDVFQDQSLTDSTSLLVSVNDGNAKTAKYWSEVISGWTRWNSLGIWTQSSSRMLSNMDENPEKSFESLLKLDNYLSKSSSTEFNIRNLSSWTVSNWNTWATSTSVWDQCNTGYFIESSSTWTSWISNWDIWSNSVTCTKWNSKTFLQQSTGVCESSWGPSEYINISNLKLLKQ